jgi:hypothetical protein
VSKSGLMIQSTAHSETEEIKKREQKRGGEKKIEQKREEISQKIEQKREQKREGKREGKRDVRARRAYLLRRRARVRLGC